MLRNKVAIFAGYGYRNIFRYVDAPEKFIPLRAARGPISPNTFTRMENMLKRAALLIVCLVCIAAGNSLAQEKVLINTTQIGRASCRERV